jgi:hypothetical protein
MAALLQLTIMMALHLTAVVQEAQETRALLAHTMGRILSYSCGMALLQIGFL